MRISEVFAGIYQRNSRPLKDYKRGKRLSAHYSSSYTYNPSAIVEISDAGSQLESTENEKNIIQEFVGQQNFEEKDKQTIQFRISSGHYSSANSMDEICDRLRELI